MVFFRCVKLCFLLLCSLSIGCGSQRTDQSIDERVRTGRLVQVDGNAEAKRETAPFEPSAHGEKQFNSYCAACHQLGGQGVEGRVPPLDDSPWVSGSEERLIRIVLNGLRGPIEIQGEIYNLEMPAFRLLFRDDDIAAILSYVRQRYGAPSPPVTSETVARVREETKDQVGYWTVEELLRIP